VAGEESTQESTNVWQILLVDDHPIVRAGLAMLLAAEQDLAVCGQAESVEAALDVIAARRPDLVLVDLSLRGAGGLELVKALARMQIRALVVSMHESPIWAERALAAGARGYVLKSEAGRVVVDAIRRVRAGRVFVSASIAEALLAHRVGAGLGAEAGERYDALTDREIEVLRRIGQGMTTRQIGADLGLSAKTVQTYRERIKRKLLLDSAAALSREATRWVLVDTSEPSAQAGPSSA
jgi:DNA-binding NarL/FixJ family response regulator